MNGCIGVAIPIFGIVTARSGCGQANHETRDVFQPEEGPRSRAASAQLAHRATSDLAARAEAQAETTESRCGGCLCCCGPRPDENTSSSTRRSARHARTGRDGRRPLPAGLEAARARSRRGETCAGSWPDGPSPGRRVDRPWRRLAVATYHARRALVAAHPRACLTTPYLPSNDATQSASDARSAGFSGAPSSGS